MSDNFNKKDYSEYFKSLENRINEPSFVRRKPTTHTPQKKKKGIYLVIRFKKVVLALVLVVVAVVLGLVIKNTVSGKEEKTPTPSQESVKTEEKVPQKRKISYFFDENSVEIPLENDAKSGIIVDRKSGKVIASRNPDQKAFPASTTKVMTLLVACENITDFNKTFTVTYGITDPLYKRGASFAGFKNGEAVTMTDLLYGLILPSGADAAVSLAISVAGSEEKFVELMNEKARELGLKNTHFANSSGLHDENNYCSAYDMAVILDAALDNEVCKKILSTKKYTTAVTEQNPEGIPLSSTLFDYMYGTEPEIATILAGKTGFVNESGYCIASYGQNNQNGNEYVIVTMGNSSRWPAFHGQIDLYKQFAK